MTALPSTSLAPATTTSPAELRWSKEYIRGGLDVLQLTAREDKGRSPGVTIQGREREVHPLLSKGS